MGLLHKIKGGGVGLLLHRRGYCTRSRGGVATTAQKGKEWVGLLHKIKKGWHKRGGQGYCTEGRGWVGLRDGTYNSVRARFTRGRELSGLDFLLFSFTAPSSSADNVWGMCII